MKVQYVLPKGWRKLRGREMIRTGDRYSFMDTWEEIGKTSTVSTPMEWGRLFIRKASK